MKSSMLSLVCLKSDTNTSCPNEGRQNAPIQMLTQGSKGRTLPAGWKIQEKSLIALAL